MIRSGKKIIVIVINFQIHLMIGTNIVLELYYFIIDGISNEKKCVIFFCFNQTKLRAKINI